MGGLWRIVEDVGLAVRVENSSMFWRDSGNVRQKLRWLFYLPTTSMDSELTARYIGSYEVPGRTFTPI